MAQLVRHDACDLVVGARGLEHAAVQKHRAAGQRKRVDLPRVHDVKRIPERRLTEPRGNRSDQARADALDENFRRAIVQHRQLLACLGGRLPAEPDVLGRREAVPARLDSSLGAERQRDENGRDDRRRGLSFQESGHAGTECKGKTIPSGFFVAHFAAELSSRARRPVPCQRLVPP